MAKSDFRKFDITVTNAVRDVGLAPIVEKLKRYFDCNVNAVIRIPAHALVMDGYGLPVYIPAPSDIYDHIHELSVGFDCLDVKFDFVVPGICRAYYYLSSSTVGVDYETNFDTYLLTQEPIEDESLIYTF